jgi:putative N6-adenine-specific DNA methylase
MEKKSTGNNGELTITLKCLFGFEQTLVEELEELGHPKAEQLNRAVRIKGTWKDVYYLNLYARCAISILVELDKFYIKSEEDLYRKSMKIKWTEIFDGSKTFAVKGAVFSTLFNNTQYPYLVVKDAIVDSFRNEFDDRPDVELKRPQVLFDLYIKENEVTISLNTSGIPLFQRGYREAVGDAPINEVVAASLIRLSKWDRKTTFLDPFCGSGTLLMEAALLASGIPSNIERQHYAFKNLKNYDEAVWNDIYDNAPRNVRSLPCRIMGSDLSDEMILKTRRNLRAMSFGRFIETKVCSFDEITKEEDEAIFILTNPPYGERLSANTHELYENIGNWLKHTMTNSQAWVITSSEEGLKSIGLRPSVKHKVFNGDLECSFRMFETYAGSKRTHFPFDENEETQEEKIDK